MTDEANALAFSIVMQLIEGHEFSVNQLDAKPKNHWSIDPFGLSSTLARVIGASNLTHMAIQRVHYSIKRYLSETRQLEFRWRQHAAGSSASTDILTHMFPFYSYDVPHTCGPDPAVRRLLLYADVQKSACQLSDLLSIRFSSPHFDRLPVAAGKRAKPCFTQIYKILF